MCVCVYIHKVKQYDEAELGAAPFCGVLQALIAAAASGGTSSVARHQFWKGYFNIYANIDVI